MTISTYKILMPCIPYPLEYKVSKTNLEAAIEYGRGLAKRMGLKSCTKRIILRDMRYEILTTKEV